MKKSIALILVLCFLSSTGMAADNLYHKFANDPEIKVYLKEVKNESGEEDVDAKTFEKVFKEELTERLAMKFVSVEKQDEADVAISATIKNYAFTEKAMPSFMGVYSLAADATAPKSQAVLTVDYVVMDAKTGRVIAERNDFTMAARRPIEDMKGKNAFKYACEKNINRFIYRTFREQEEQRM